jgi:hypothetical protein
MGIMSPIVVKCGLSGLYYSAEERTDVPDPLPAKVDEQHWQRWHVAKTAIKPIIMG